jgi:hypothetical protein
MNAIAALIDGKTVKFTAFVLVLLFAFNRFQHRVSSRGVCLARFQFNAAQFRDLSVNRAKPKRTAHCASAEEQKRGPKSPERIRGLRVRRWRAG